MSSVVTVAVLAPIVGAAIAGLFGRRIGNIPSQAVTTGLLFLSCALSWFTFIQHTWGGMEDFTVQLLPFINIGDFHSAWSVRIDGLSATMLIVVTTVSSLVHLYSWGYMAEDDSRPRFFAYLSLFTFAMLMLVTAADFMQLFFGWEGVGLASYLLIGFWYYKDSASSAAIKAFVVNRVGDFGFALGIMTVFWQFHTINFHELFQPGVIAAWQGKGWEFLGQTFSALDIAAFLLFIGAMGKSAQFFLHTWLPDAMEGPTPVSALIHAATMVTAGVYMVCLLSPLFEYAPVAKEIVAYIGAITAIFAASIGFTQNDIKRVIAYSTCSQLGYMFFAAGVGAYPMAMFHLFTHAFFKALLFLGAGSVIHGMHHEQDMRKMGGLWKYLPVTYGVMMIGTIAITGLGIPFTKFGFAGFFSKDAILEAAWAAHGTPQGMFAFVMGIAAALLTSFYSWRLIAMTFHGKKQWEHDAHAHDDHGHDAHAHDDHHHDAHGHDAHGHDDHGHGHAHTPHESPWVMLTPLVVLAFGAMFAGFIFAPYFIGEHHHEFWGHAIFLAPTNEVMEKAEHITDTWVHFAPLIVTLLGMALAWFFYVANPKLPKAMAAIKGPIYTFLYNKWFFDEIYQATLVKLTKFLGDVFWKIGDIKIIDGLGPNGAAWTALASAKRLVKTQTGYVYHYAFFMFLGVAGLLTWVVFGMAN